ncbi:MAG: hypothetical protein JXR83_14230 [Deltaproteobacteria bacterium]|nr:hypothetical protein [Deltaproteobacteria bacterium]
MWSRSRLTVLAVCVVSGLTDCAVTQCTACMANCTTCLTECSTCVSLCNSMLVVPAGILLVQGPDSDRQETAPASPPTPAVDERQLACGADTAMPF